MKLGFFVFAVFVGLTVSKPAELENEVPVEERTPLSARLQPCSKEFYAGGEEAPEDAGCNSEATEEKDDELEEFRVDHDEEVNNREEEQEEEKTEQAEEHVEEESEGFDESESREEEEGGFEEAAEEDEGFEDPVDENEDGEYFQEEGEHEEGTGDNFESADTLEGEMYDEEDDQEEQDAAFHGIPVVEGVSVLPPVITQDDLEGFAESDILKTVLVGNEEVTEQDFQKFLGTLKDRFLPTEQAEGLENEEQGHTHEGETAIHEEETPSHLDESATHEQVLTPTEPGVHGRDEPTEINVENSEEETRFIEDTAQTFGYEETPEEKINEEYIKEGGNTDNEEIPQPEEENPEEPGYDWREEAGEEEKSEDLTDEEKKIIEENFNKEEENKEGVPTEKVVEETGPTKVVEKEEINTPTPTGPTHV